MRGDAPDAPQWITELARTVTVELILDGPDRFRTRVERYFEHGIDVFEVDADRHG